MRVLYLISDFFALLLIHIVKYRKEVIKKNLQNSFPNLTAKEIEAITKKYYIHLADVIVEGVKMLTISKRQLMRRYKCLNPEVLQPYFEQRQSVILVSAHYNDWEFMVLSLDMQFKHHGIGVGKILSSKVFEYIMYKKRTRYGTEVVYADSVRHTFEKYRQENRPCAYMMLFDQSPNSISRCYITNFLSQKTAVIYGQEYFAKKYDYPVFFYSVRKVKRGYYEFELDIVESNPTEAKYGEITEKCLSHLANLINEAPQYWIWSHRRWKYKL
jgi:KDO2-lipid IV(A) lauroyltransferase